MHDGHDHLEPRVTGRNLDRRPPLNCPVCSEKLALTRLACPAFSTELSGAFATCEFCALSDDDREVLRVFLASRGNMKELERHLGVSYPTARARFDALLARIGVVPERPQTGSRVDLLERLARGEIDIDEAMDSLER